MPTKKFRQSGFTIVEIIIIIVVLVILALMTIVSYNGIQDRSRLAAAKTDLTSIAKAASSFAVIYGRQPVNDADFGEVLREAGVYEKTRDFDSTSFAICADSESYVIVAWNPVVDQYKNKDILYIYSAGSQDEFTLKNSSLMAKDTIGKTCTQVYGDSTYRKWTSQIP